MPIFHTASSCMLLIGVDAYIFAFGTVWNLSLSSFNDRKKPFRDNMSVFYDFTLEGAYTCVAWHHVLPLIAAGKDHGRIVIYTEDGEELDAQSGVADVRKDGVPPTKLQWGGQMGQFLAIGWSNGLLGVWSNVTNAYLDFSGHKSPITCIEWNINKNRLVTGDEVMSIGADILLFLNSFLSNTCIAQMFAGW